VIRTLEEIREQYGASVYGFALVLTGAIVGSEEEKAAFSAIIREQVDGTMTHIERKADGAVELTGLMLRVETAEAYMASGLPNAVRNPLPLRRGKKEIHPDDFVCSLCGGGYIPEVIGMFAGKRYIHTCGVTNRDALALD